MTAKFPLGQTVATPGALAALAAANLPAFALLARHAAGDWGEVDDFDREQNERALRDGDRLLSAYTVGGERVWVITEWNRSATTLLLPEEY
ncbi:MAG TPA: hypothetical protein VFL91_21320 [Thermomicrobiales bacterium]|nr:hypothetical protein [Thermomicrobiales bacterium]